MKYLILAIIFILSGCIANVEEDPVTQDTQQASPQTALMVDESSSSFQGVPPTTTTLVMQSSSSQLPSSETNDSIISSSSQDISSSSEEISSSIITQSSSSQILQVFKQVFVDPRDSIQYATYTDGITEWFAEPLKYNADSVGMYKLTEYELLDTICPTGWKVPTIKNFEDLFDALQMSQVSHNSTDYARYGGFADSIMTDLKSYQCGSDLEWAVWGDSTWTDSTFTAYYASPESKDSNGNYITPCHIGEYFRTFARMPTNDGFAYVDNISYVDGEEISITLGEIDDHVINKTKPRQLFCVKE